MNKVKAKKSRIARRHARVRAKISGTAAIPRLSVYRSLQHIFVQLIDDVNGRTLVSAKDAEIKAGKMNKTEVAAAVGKLIAEKAQAAKISQAVFDRGQFRYHGRVKAVAEAAREAGLKI